LSFLTQLSFGAPWVLVALAALPAVWFLLRVTPPLPKRVVFPPLRLLLGLKGDEETPAHTPLWLLLLRMIAAAAVILALAEPLLGRSVQIAGSGPVVLFVDDGWTAAAGWAKRQALIAEVLREAGHDGRATALVTTADRPDTSLLDAGEAARRGGALAPEPWRGDRMRAVQALVKARLPARPKILWLSDGVDDGHAKDTAQTLAGLGDLTVYADAKSPLALLPPASEANGFAATVIRAGGVGARGGTLEAEGAHGEVLGTAPFRFADGEEAAKARIVLPLQVRNEAARLTVAGEDSAGAVQLFDTGAPRRAVGLVSAANATSEQPLLSDLYYLDRALSPYAEVHRGTISRLVNERVGVLVLADIGRVAGTDRDKVASFVAGGGLLIRFAGERMTGEADDLVPVKLRVGGRYLGGALAWASPQHLAAFPDTSPFGGLQIPDDVTVSRQILAEPSVQLSERSWARLADGTPLVTAEQRGKGWIVLFHITAGPGWSSLPLSGLYVDMLKRLLMLAGGASPGEMAGAATLPAYQTLDGFGRLHAPEADALPLRAAALAKTVPSRAHPPGLYGVRGAAFALNAANAETTLTPMGETAAQPYVQGGAIPLEPPLLALALLLILVDALISLGLRGLLPALRVAAAVVVLLHVAVPPARADDAFDLKAALDTRLAYVETGLADVDAMSRAGLTGLGNALKARTSYPAADPVGVDVSKDDLSFFPLLYWPMDPREKDLTPQALSRIADYMRGGGTIFFDTRDLSLGAVRGAQSPGEQTLRRLTSKLDLPPLETIPHDHVLTKTFYLLQDFPGRYEGGKLWVEALPPSDPNAPSTAARGGDGVSPVIIGGNDWAAAWAVDESGRPVVDVVPGGGRQREMAIRFGINLVMYTLTGNYKADQVHVHAILERLKH
jgi:uncharacterized protein DUF4159/aerotolerance regulator-like protein